MIGNSKSSLLDATRWFAALVVLVGHADMFALQRTGYKAFGIEYIGDHSHSAVIMFFVLSGFVIALSVDQNKNLNFKKYFLDRFSRIYSVLPLAIIFTATLDFIGSGLSSSYLNPTFIPQDNYIVRLLVNLFSMQGAQGYRVQFGSNPALWSIGYEVFYYFIFGIIYFWKEIFRNNKSLAYFVVATLFVIAGIKIASYFFIWLIGFIAYKAQKKYSLSSSFFWIFLLLFLMVNYLVVYKSIANFEFFDDFLLGLFFSLLLLPNTPNLGNPGAHKFMADFSFSLYAFHMPILFFSYFVIFRNDTPLYIFSLITLFFCLIFCYLTSLITEKKRYWLRDFIIKHINK